MREDRVTSIEDLARKVVAMYGGTWEPPEVVTIETQPPDIVEQTPIQTDKWSAVVFPRLPSVDAAWRRFQEDPLQPLDLVHFERRVWATTVWVPEREEYDPKENVLRLYGYTRVHRFDVWVPLESSDQSGK